MKILLVTQNIPHYRQPIYELLCSNVKSDLNYIIAADQVSHLAGLQVLNKEELPAEAMLRRKWILCQNKWLPFGLLWQKDLIHKAVNGHIDVVIMTGNVKYLSVWIILIIRRFKGLKSVLWTHGLLKPDRGFKKLLRGVFYRLADGLLLYGERGKKLVSEGGLSGRYLAVVYNSLNYQYQINIAFNIINEDLDELKNELKIPKNNSVLITMGRLTFAKRVDLLINSLVHLMTSHDISLIVVGEGSELDKLKTLAKDKNLEQNIVFYGSCYDENTIGRLMLLSDVFVLPGDAGLSVIHGLTYGIPVITHDDMSSQKPEVEAIIEGLSGSFYRAGDIVDLSNKIAYWIARCKANKQKVMMDCRSRIANYYTPNVQLDIINKAVLDIFKDNDV